MQSSEKHSDHLLVQFPNVVHSTENSDFTAQLHTKVPASSFLNGRNTTSPHILVVFFSFPSPTVETDAEVDTTIGSEAQLEHSSALPLISSPRVIEKTLLSHRTIYCLA